MPRRNRTVAQNVATVPGLVGWDRARTRARVHELLDSAGRRRLQTEFGRIQRELGTTVILVTHDIDEAVLLGDRIAVLAPGGRLDQLAEPLSILARPATDVVAELVGEGRAVRMLVLTQLQLEDLDPGALPAGGRPGTATDAPADAKAGPAGSAGPAV